MAGRKPAESPLAEREKKRECGAGVSQNGGSKRVDTRGLRFHSLLCCYAPSELAACAAAELCDAAAAVLEGTLEFIWPASGLLREWESPRQRERPSLPGQDADQKFRAGLGRSCMIARVQTCVPTQVGKILSKFSQ